MPRNNQCRCASPSIVFFAKFSIVVQERCIYRTVYGCKVRNAEKCAFSRVFQLYVYEKRPRRIASSRSLTMRFRLAVFAKIAIDGCALRQILSRCKPVYRAFCKVFYRCSGKMYLPSRLRLQGQKRGKMCIFPCFSALYLRKKTSENCFSKVSISMRLRIAGFAKIAMEGCALRHRVMTLYIV